MGLVRVSWPDARPVLGEYSAVIDARSPSEFALDHLPGAVNWPTLSDAQRHEVGTLYAQVSTFEARKKGAAWAAANIAAHLEREGPALSRDWKPLVYCWRGGQRSGALGIVLSQIGFQVAVLDNGYRGFRRYVSEALAKLPEGLHFEVLCGTTGSGKSRVLEGLEEAGEQVLDLERLAQHRGSVLGELSTPQPSQKAFESALWQQLTRFDPERPVWVEAESRTIGRLRLPESLLQRIRSDPCWRLEASLEERVSFLLREYAHHRDTVELLCTRLDGLRAVCGHEVINRWQAAARAGDWRTLVAQLLTEHYDPIYLKSMAHNFAGYAQATPVALMTLNAAGVDQAVRELLHKRPTHRGPPLQGPVEGL